MGIFSDIIREDKVEMCPDACCGKPITECKCGPDCEHCDCHSKNSAMNEGTQGCADCEWIKDETDGDITTCDECAAEKREKTNEAVSEGFKIRDKSRGYGVSDKTYKTREEAKDAAVMKSASSGGDWEVIEETNESEKRWKQTSMSPQEAIAKYGKENVKVKKGALRNGDDMVEVFVESMNEAGGYYTQPVYDMIEQHGIEKVMHELLTALDADVIQDALSRMNTENESYSPGDEYADSEGMVSNCCGAPMYDYHEGHGRCSDCKDMAAGETDEEYYESKVMQAREQIAQEESPVIEADDELQRIIALSNHGIKKAPIEENFIDEMPHGLLDGMTFTDGNPDYDYRGNPMNYGEVDWPEINDRHKDENGNVRPEATIKPEDFAVDDLLPG